MNYYDEFDNKFYNPDDDDAKPGANLNWKKIQRGFKRVEGATAEGYSLAAEGYAKGTQNGEAVEEGSPYYQNNAKYYAEEAEEIAESIPADYSVLSSDVDKIKNVLIDGSRFFSVVENSYITTNGVITPYNGWSRTDYISCDAYDQLKVRFTSGAASMYNVFYDENKAPIANSSFVVNPNTDNIISIPEGASYVILSNSTSAINTYEIWMDTVNVSILNYVNPYCNLSGLGGMTGVYKFDSITFLYNGEVITKTWKEFTTALPGYVFYVDDAKVLNAGYITPERPRVMIDKSGQFKRVSDAMNTSTTIFGGVFDASDVYANPTQIFGTLPEQARNNVFNIPRELQKELPLNVVIELDAKEDTLYSKFDDSDFVMGYYSDNHMYGFEVGVETPMTALALARYDKHIDFDSILCCGDSVLSYSESVYPEDGSPYTALRQANFMLNRDKLLFVEGNHDRNIVSPVMPTKDFVNLMYRPLKRQSGVHFGGEGRPYFYRDFAEHKIRIICLDLYDVLPDESYNYHSGYKQDQMEWLANTALAVPDSNWHVLVATHAAPYGESDGMTDNGAAPYNSNVLIGILESFKNGTSVTINSTAVIAQIPSYSITTQFTNAGNLIGCFVGHNHVDVDLVKNDIHYVSIECAYIEDNDKNYREAFTYTAIAFDVVIINTTSRTVEFCRIGYGNDRDYTY